MSDVALREAGGLTHEVIDLLLIAKGDIKIVAESLFGDSKLVSQQKVAHELLRFYEMDFEKTLRVVGYIDVLCESLAALKRVLVDSNATESLAIFESFDERLNRLIYGASYGSNNPVNNGVVIRVEQSDNNGRTSIDAYS